MKIERFNYVIGYAGFGGSTIIKNGINFRVDHTEPITLKRVQKIYQEACDFADKKFDRITICYSVYADGSEDSPGECLKNKEYRYDPTNNSLIIFDKGKPVYANDNGFITTDQAALYDTLCD